MNAHDDNDHDSCVTKLQHFDSLFENFFSWLGGQYDPKTGGFFHARSSFLIEGLIPDIESTTFAVSILNRYNALGYLPVEIKQNIIRFLLARYDQKSGLFLDANPLMQQDEVMVYRAQIVVTTALKSLGVTDTRRVFKTEFPEYMKTPQSMVSWMKEVELTNAWRGCDKMGSVMTYIKFMPSNEQTAFMEAAWSYLESIVDPKTGFWGFGRPLIRLSGTFKILHAFYCHTFKGNNSTYSINSLGKVPYKHLLKQSVFTAMRNDTPEDFCWIRNPVDILYFLDIPLTDHETKELVSHTVDSIVALHRIDGGFSRELGNSPAATNCAQVKSGDGHKDIPIPVILSKGLVESDMNAGTQVGLVRELCYRLAGVPIPSMEEYIKKINFTG